MFSTRENIQCCVCFVRINTYKPLCIHTVQLCNEITLIQNIHQLKYLSINKKKLSHTEKVRDIDKERDKEKERDKVKEVSETERQKERQKRETE